ELSRPARAALAGVSLLRVTRRPSCAARLRARGHGARAGRGAAADAAATAARPDPRLALGRRTDADPDQAGRGAAADRRRDPHALRAARPRGACGEAPRRLAWAGRAALRGA